VAVDVVAVAVGVRVVHRPGAVDPQEAVPHRVVTARDGDVVPVLDAGAELRPHDQPGTELRAQVRLQVRPLEAVPLHHVFLPDVTYRQVGRGFGRPAGRARVDVVLRRVRVVDDHVVLVVALVPGRARPPQLQLLWRDAARLPPILLRLHPGALEL